MLKKIFLIVVATLLGAYIIFALVILPIEKKSAVCSGINITIENNGSNSLGKADIEKILKGKNLIPTGRNMNEIDCSLIEQCISEYSIIKECQCYKTHTGAIGIDIECKEPIMLVQDLNEDQFCIDCNGDIIEGAQGDMYIPVASGRIERSMAKKELKDIALFLMENRFWKEQIEQVYFTQKKEVILIPRVGNHTIELGSAKDLEQKLEKLEKFYAKGLNNIGWNKYSKLNVEFDNRVIGTRR